MVERGERIAAKDSGQVMVRLAIWLRDGDGSGGREAQLVMLFMKRTQHGYLPDRTENF